MNITQAVFFSVGYVLKQASCNYKFSNCFGVRFCGYTNAFFYQTEEIGHLHNFTTTTRILLGFLLIFKFGSPSEV